MKQRERLQAGLIYAPMDEEVMKEQAVYQQRVWEFNRLSPKEFAEKEQYMKKNFAACGENCYIELPFYANWGGKNLHLGDDVYANFGLTVVDDDHIYIGNKVMIAPHVTLTTANHPIHEELRAHGLQYNRPIHIEDNVWLGAGVVVCPGVTIGEGSVIGAGAVVTRDIPAHSVAMGVPARVVRTIGAHDREYYFREEKIDWENVEKMIHP